MGSFGWDIRIGKTNVVQWHFVRTVTCNTHFKFYSLQKYFFANFFSAQTFLWNIVMWPTAYALDTTIETDI